MLSSGFAFWSFEHLDARDHATMIHETHLQRLFRACWKAY